MTQQEEDENTIVILSDDDEEEEQALNDSTKRKRRRFENEEDEDEGEEYDSIEDYDSMEEYEAYESFIKSAEGQIFKSQTLPDDHEPVVLSERDQENVWKDLDTILTDLKQICIPDSITLDDVETNFACGIPVKDNAPDIAINVEGILGPITFPLCPKDAQRILDTTPDKNTCCFSLDTSKVLLNLTFQEYLFETLLPEIYSYLGVSKEAAENTLLQANQFYICQKGKTLNISQTTSKGAYGTVMLILPSDYSGGHVQIDYQGETCLFQPETDTFHESYYIAWYNDTTTNFHPVTSGYQTSIILSLIYTGQDPTINTASLQKQRIMIENGYLNPTQEAKCKVLMDQAIQSFQSELVKNHQEPLLYFLKYSYALPGITIDHLKQSDKITTDLLQDIASETGYNMYLGLVQRTVDAQVSEVDDYSIDEEGIHLAQTVLKDTFTLVSLNDEEGNNILPGPVILPSENPMIQGVQWFAKCKPEEEDYNEKEKKIKYIYAKRSALVFIPKSKLDSFVKLKK
ncbi:hypothetical protein BD770DRAFT_410220 [Pilaira anomala]|nr:hypothetical protein BD770DRAFT_410220 [Pilaira anomala]